MYMYMLKYCALIRTWQVYLKFFTGTLNHCQIIQFSCLISYQGRSRKLWLTCDFLTVTLKIWEGREMRLTRSSFNVFGYATVNLWSRTCVFHLRGTLIETSQKLVHSFFCSYDLYHTVSLPHALVVTRAVVIKVGKVLPSITRALRAHTHARLASALSCNLDICCRRPIPTCTRPVRMSRNTCIM